MPIRAIIFDFEGVLMRTEELMSRHAFMMINLNVLATLPNVLSAHILAKKSQIS